MTGKTMPPHLSTPEGAIEALTSLLDADWARVEWLGAGRRGPFSKAGAPQVARYQDSDNTLVLPLTIHQGTLGVLTLHRDGSRPFQASEVEQLGHLAQLIALQLVPRAADLESREMEEMMDMTLANAPMVFGMFDRDYRVAMAQGHGLDMTGFPAAALIGRYAADLLGRDPEPLSAISKAFSGTHAQAVWTSSNSGHRFSGFMAPVQDRGGQVTAVCMVTIDITAQQRAEQARREKEAKSRFLSNTSHELRTPLNAILGFTQLLERQTDYDETESRYIRNLRSSSTQLLALINNLLDLAKIQANLLEVRSEPVDLRDMIKQVIGEVEPQATAKGVQLSLHASRRPVVRADPQRLLQVLRNLVGNAVQVGDEGGMVRQTIRPTNGMTELQIAVTWRATEPLDSEDIFEDFASAATDTLQPQHETGLELPLSRRLVDLMGGQLTLASRPGQDRSFVLQLPTVSRPSAQMTQGQV